MTAKQKNNNSQNETLARKTRVAQAFAIWANLISFKSLSGYFPNSWYSLRVLVGFWVSACTGAQDEKTDATHEIWLPLWVFMLEPRGTKKTFESV